MDKKGESKSAIIVKKEPVRYERWYFGGLSGVLAACCTHPLDTLKVQLQTQQRADYGLICKTNFLFNQKDQKIGFFSSSYGCQSDT
jgi:hypothetical protein